MGEYGWVIPNLDTYAFNAFIPVITQVTMNVDYFIACAVKGRIERN